MRWYVFSAQRGLVAQICNLPYRRLVIGRASESSSAPALVNVPQNAILRYSRLQICATLNTCPVFNRQRVDIRRRGGLQIRDTAEWNSALCKLRLRRAESICGFNSV